MNNKGKRSIYNITIASLFLALSIIMPQVVHLVGVEAGKILLPLFWGVACAALILPLPYVLYIAILSPLLSSFITGMPPVPMLYFMLIEIPLYGVFVHVLHKKFSAPISILLGLIGSRTVYIVSVVFAVNVLGMQMQGAALTMLLLGVFKSAPGIIAQMIIAPLSERVYLGRRHYEQ